MLKDILESRKVLENSEFEVTEHNGFLKRLEEKLKNIDEDIDIVYERSGDSRKVVITKIVDDTDDIDVKTLEKEIKNILGTKIFYYNVKINKKFNDSTLTITANFQAPYKLVEELNKKLSLEDLFALRVLFDNDKDDITKSLDENIGWKPILKEIKI